MPSIKTILTVGRKIVQMLGRLTLPIFLAKKMAYIARRYQISLKTI